MTDLNHERTDRTMGDKYDEAIAYLTAHPDKIEDAWGYGSHADDDDANPGAVLFQGVTPDGRVGPCGGKVCGCLTQVRRGRVGAGVAAAVAYTPELTDAIRADERIPTDVELVTLADLPVFADWQRRVDAELGRVAKCPRCGDGPADCECQRSRGPVAYPANPEPEGGA